MMMMMTFVVPRTLSSYGELLQPLDHVCEMNEWKCNDLGRIKTLYGPRVHRISPVEKEKVYGGNDLPAAQSRHHLRTVYSTAEGTPFSREAWTRRSVTSDMLRLRKTLITYLFTVMLMLHNSLLLLFLLSLSSYFFSVLPLSLSLSSS